VKLVVAAAVALPLVFAVGAVVPGGAAMAAGPTANQLASKALASLKTAKTYHLWGSNGSGKNALTLNVTRGTNGCKGTESSDGSAVSFVQIGGTTWLGEGGMWFKESTSQASEALGYCNSKTVASLVPVFSGLSLGPVTKVSGERVQELKGTGQIIYVTTGTKPEEARYQLPGPDPEQLNFSGINASVRVSPPSGTILG